MLEPYKELKPEQCILTCRIVVLASMYQYLTKVQQYNFLQSNSDVKNVRERRCNVVLPVVSLEYLWPQ